MKEISQIDLARLAAYVDGEGEISINAYHVTERSGHRAKHTRAIISVSNSDIRLVQWVKELVNVGSIHANMRTARSSERNWKPVYNWRCQNEKACEIVEAILPYLIIKRERAEIVLAFRKLVLRGTNRRFGVPPDNQEKRLQLVQEIRQLNRRGIGVAL